MRKQKKQLASNAITRLKKHLNNLADPKKALFLQRFFKTGPGEYAAGDRFLGITVPVMRKLAKQYHCLDRPSLQLLIQSEIHEQRLLALLILTSQYERAVTVQEKMTIYRFVVANLRWINNWDLVDVMVPKIIGHYLYDKDKKILYSWARSKNLWKRRIAIVSTFHFIRQQDHQPTLALAALLLTDSEDLIHKATGWMLREVGKRDMQVLEDFLKIHHATMPRTMLRYAIERFPEAKRQAYLQGKIQ